MPGIKRKEIEQDTNVGFYFDMEGRCVEHPFEFDPFKHKLYNDVELLLNDIGEEMAEANEERMREEHDEDNDGEDVTANMEDIKAFKEAVLKEVNSGIHTAQDVIKTILETVENYDNTEPHSEVLAVGFTATNSFFAGNKRAKVNNK